MNERLLINNVFLSRKYGLVQLSLAYFIRIILTCSFSANPLRQLWLFSIPWHNHPSLNPFFFNLIFFLFSVKKSSNHHSQFWSWFRWSARAYHWLVQWKGEDILSNYKRKNKLMSSNSSIVKWVSQGWCLTVIFYFPIYSTLHHLINT